MRNKLEKHLKPLFNSGSLKTWHDRHILPGADWRSQIDLNLDKADIVLLLVSADFVASDYCYDIEMERALERHDANEVEVIPVILRDVDWGFLPIGKLQALPRDAKPITSWEDEDAAFADVARGIRLAITTLQANKKVNTTVDIDNNIERELTGKKLPEENVIEKRQVPFEKAANIQLDLLEEEQEADDDLESGNINFGFDQPPSKLDNTSLIEANNTKNNISFSVDSKTSINQQLETSGDSKLESPASQWKLQPDLSKDDNNSTGVVFIPKKVRKFPRVLSIVLLLLLVVGLGGVGLPRLLKGNNPVDTNVQQQRVDVENPANTVEPPQVLTPVPDELPNNVEEVVQSDVIESTNQDLTALPTTDEDTVSNAIEPQKVDGRTPVLQNSGWTPQIEEINGTRMALVPAGSFTIGSEDSWFEDEKNGNIVEFTEPFWIDETEVSREAYEVCARVDSRCSEAPTSEYSTTLSQPIIVRWSQAAAYCEWRGARLPTEAEWEYAARGPDALKYPWGNQWDANRLQSRESSNFGIAPVGSFPTGQSWVGALDMAGNVSELTSTLYQDYPYSDLDGRNIKDYQNFVSSILVIRGGSFNDTSDGLLRSAFRFESYVDGFRANNGGFRCVRSNSGNDLEDTTNEAVVEEPSVEIEMIADKTPDGGTRMALVPAGTFKIGSEDGDDNEKNGNEIQFTEPFYIDETEVTRADFEACARVDTRCGEVLSSEYSTTANQPINFVSWYQAAAYCEWRGARLPTEAEWEYAARGPDELTYPWGNQWDANKTNSYEENSSNPTVATVPVGSYPRGESWVGALDMAGNVWEWTSTLYQGYPYSETDGRNIIGYKDNILNSISIRGGSFIDDSIIVRSVDRGRGSADDFNQFIGFRCARSNSDF